MYTAIVLDKASQILLIKKAADLGLIHTGDSIRCHHVTLAMGRLSGFKIGETRELLVTHHGDISGRVTAFRVLGAGDSKNMFPHVTIAVSDSAKPVESNQIVEWSEITPFAISGKIEFCD